MQSTMMDDYPLTLPPLLARAERLFPGVEIVSRRPDRSIARRTYAEVGRRARALAEALTRAGLRKGDRVATLMWNHGDHLEAYFGIPLAGGVLHTLNLRLHPKDIAYIATHAHDRFLIVDDVLLPLYHKFAGATAFERVFVVSHGDGEVAAPLERYEDLLATATGRFEPPPIDERDAAGMCYTSGTTGEAKGVVYSHRSLVLHSLAASLADLLAVRQLDTMLVVVPMFHVNAWGIPFSATMMGVKQVFPGPHYDAESLLDLVEREEVTIAAGVPTIWSGILQALDAQPTRWRLQPGLRFVVGGSAVPESMIRAFDRHGITIIHAWGMTETTPLGTVCTVKKSLLGSSDDARYALRAKQGLPAPFVDLRVMGEEGEVAWDGVTMGELHIRGPWIAASYHDRPDTTGCWSADGWFRTGDVVTIDAEGYVKITDRTKDLIKSGGEWISSVDLENALMGHPAVREAAVVAVPDARWQERPLAVVVVREGLALRADEVRDFLAPRFPKWWLPDDVVFVTEIPKTSTGKFLKRQLRDEYAARAASPPAESRAAG